MASSKSSPQPEADLPPQVATDPVPVDATDEPSVKLEDIHPAVGRRTGKREFHAPYMDQTVTIGTGKIGTDAEAIDRIGKNPPRDQVILGGDAEAPVDPSTLTDNERRQRGIPPAEGTKRG